MEMHLLLPQNNESQYTLFLDNLSSGPMAIKIWYKHSIAITDNFMSILELVTRFKTEKLKMLPKMNKNNVVYTVVEWNVILP